MKKYLLSFSSLLITALAVLHPAALAETPAPSPTEAQAALTPTPSGGEVLATTTSKQKQIEDLNNRINDLQGKISDLKGQQRTLSAQISSMDSQIQLTEYRIAATEQQISDLEQDIQAANNRILTLEGSLTNISKVLIDRIVATYEYGKQDPLNILLTSESADDYFKRLNYLRIVQSNDKRLLYDMTQAKNDYANQKNILEDKKKKIQVLQQQLEDYSKQIAIEKQKKQKLLTETQGSEANYQRLLSQAQAQLAGFSRFATTQGGASIIPAQPSPDGWYYNQRDERWGRNGIGSSGEPVWKYGCLLTSVAMLLKQQGENVTPAEVAGNDGYFFADTAYMNIPWGGGRFTSVWGRDLSAIDARLASGKPVIIGLNAGQYGTHFVVFKSGSNGNYVMNDPWYGPNLPFTSHYATGQIFQYGYLK